MTAGLEGANAAEATVTGEVVARSDMEWVWSVVLEAAWGCSVDRGL